MNIINSAVISHSKLLTITPPVHPIFIGGFVIPIEIQIVTLRKGDNGKNKINGLNNSRKAKITLIKLRKRENYIFFYSNDINKVISSQCKKEKLQT